MMNLTKEYVNNSGETITLTKDGPNYIVECFDHSNVSRWCKMIKDENEANIEFERWRA